MATLQERLTLETSREEHERAAVPILDLRDIQSPAATDITDSEAAALHKLVTALTHSSVCDVETRYCHRSAITLYTDGTCSVQHTDHRLAADGTVACFKLYRDVIRDAVFSFDTVVDLVNHLISRSARTLVVVNDERSRRTFICGSGTRLIL